MTAAKITGADPRVYPDAKDAAILAERVAARALHDGPQVGDWILYADGREGRLTYEWGEVVQTTPRNGSGHCGSFHLGHAGHLSYSGSLDPAIPKADLTDTGEVRPGRCWFFQGGYPAAHSAVEAEIPCRVWRERGAS